MTPGLGDSKVHIQGSAMQVMSERNRRRVDMAQEVIRYTASQRRHHAYNLMFRRPVSPDAGIGYAGSEGFKITATFHDVPIPDLVYVGKTITYADVLKHVQKYGLYDALGILISVEMQLLPEKPFKLPGQFDISCDLDVPHGWSEKFFPERP